MVSLESLHDGILQAAATCDLSLDGPPESLDDNIKVPGLQLFLYIALFQVCHYSTPETCSLI